MRATERSEGGEMEKYLKMKERGDTEREIQEKERERER